MTLLTRKVDYALLVLSHLHERPQGACAREIATRFGLSRAFVANILKELCSKGYVSSHRGVKGGYSLLRPPERVTLAEFIEALEHQAVRLAPCMQTDPDDGCSLVEKCPVRRPIAAVHHRIRAVLDGVTLAELFRPRASARAEFVSLGV
jgi:Rrf2 family protein